MLNKILEFIAEVFGIIIISVIACIIGSSLLFVAFNIKPLDVEPIAFPLFIIIILLIILIGLAGEISGSIRRIEEKIVPKEEEE